MRRHFLRTAGLAAIALAIVACGGRSTETTQAPQKADAEANVLLAQWAGPYGGVPAFDRMDLAAVKPALEEGMAKNL